MQTQQNDSDSPNAGKFVWLVQKEVWKGETFFKYQKTQLPDDTPEDPEGGSPTLSPSLNPHAAVFVPQTHLTSNPEVDTDQDQVAQARAATEDGWDGENGSEEEKNTDEAAVDDEVVVKKEIVDEKVVDNEAVVVEKVVKNKLVDEDIAIVDDVSVVVGDGVVVGQDVAAQDDVVDGKKFVGEKEVKGKKVDTEDNCFEVMWKNFVKKKRVVGERKVVGEDNIVEDGNEAEPETAVGEVNVVDANTGVVFRRVVDAQNVAEADIDLTDGDGSMCSITDNDIGDKGDDVEKMQPEAVETNVVSSKHKPETGIEKDIEFRMACLCCSFEIFKK